MEEKAFYHVAAYLRLSREDASGGAESNSIGSQRELLCSYIRKQGNMEIYSIYVDDGWSGVSFDRPSFRRMMEDIEAGHIDCVIVKDLSRLGRDYIEAGRLIQKTFPAFSVRFIALNDGFDSLTADFNERTLVLPVRNFVNDAYCSDISKKVKSHQQMKREKGEFIGAFAAYGYRKSPEERNRLLVDEYAAGIVKRIFAWRIAGLSNLGIAERLNGMGILSPMEYKKSRGERFSTGFATHIRAQWSAVAVKRILENELYRGVMVQGKREKVNHKVSCLVEKPREEWVRVENTHRAIVSAEDFGLVQDLLQTEGRPSGGEAMSHMFTGLLYCGDCGRPMIRRVNRYQGEQRVSFICPARARQPLRRQQSIREEAPQGRKGCLAQNSKKGAGCTRHSIPETELKRLVLVGLGQQLSLFLDRDAVLAQAGKMELQMDEAEIFRREIQRLRREQEKYAFLRARLYKDWEQGVLTEEDYRELQQIYEIQYQEAEEAIERQEKEHQKMLEGAAATRENLERLKTTLEITEINRAVLVAFVHRILVYEDKRVSLRFRTQHLLRFWVNVPTLAEGR